MAAPTRGGLSDAEWDVLRDLLPPEVGRVGRPALSNRRMLDATLCVLRTGAPWRDLPDGFGVRWNSVSCVSRAGFKRDVWRTVLDALTAERACHAHHSVDSSLVRAHRHAAGARGRDDECLGRSRGGFGTKVHLRTDANGLPLGFVLTRGEAHESRALPRLMALTGVRPGWLLGDRAYDGDQFRQTLLAHGIAPVIPPRARRLTPATYDPVLYRERNRIERAVGRLKKHRRVATRFEKRGIAFLGMLYLGAIRLWARFVNRA